MPTPPQRRIGLRPQRLIAYIPGIVGITLIAEVKTDAGDARILEILSTIINLIRCTIILTKKS
jgi:hypothetical protein